ncbi:MAG: aminotransferase class V-fold PLP-dependent enzyme [Brevibacterium sp.]|uniref:aminotransferase class I/II-fold pyridoxal phosphate-dependent enzyme n=1 Tax=Brevibacterium sp. TaxID=1701 RepID=UPI00264811B0|nr:aminotransferase class V-fold PLP-dependent enzyme [Brevibacterium sp.]MDN6135560.1 aminotransferase class V-fold PLP-dependent enzyme [Brevibacterium sp.]MDN6175774.1 aminotransferase class V-fold PLP-dependent enzyme [Brevibacterium sp.]MDN6188494.1 aminotransferase class V-fold PLP-dependent enzyme [Brevibacterium sp.]MDN6192223.1 aminotransferase class V-fold PLP-dependent enzyme [Brevibacterium sp.]MDN6604259.1 aminotransferase class V-fold PLP-dependent enzyme [Brevibacterium sp.]
MTSASDRSALPGDATTHAPYADALQAAAERDSLFLSTPGHGGTATGISAGQAEYFGEHILSLDIPPLFDGIDLGVDTPKDEALQLAAEAWGARRTWFLTNGSSQGNRMAALAIGTLGTGVVTQRSAHSSFIDGIVLAGLNPGFVFPNVDEVNGIAHGVTPDSLRQAIASHPEKVTAVYLVTPSYFGAVADVRALAEVAHDAGAALIIDAAWGAHFGFHPDLPESPVTLGADIVIMSAHKLAGSFTQSALLHLGDTELADRLEPALARAFMMTASTSENAHLMASIDIARRDLVNSHDAISDSLENIRQIRARIEGSEHYHLLSGDFMNHPDVVDIDPFRLPIDITSTGLDGHAVRKRLTEDFDIFAEMATATTIVALIGVGKRPDLSRLFEALDQMRFESADPDRAEVVSAAAGIPSLPSAGRLVALPRDAYFADSELVPAAEAIGRTSVSSLAAYPPGIPNVLPGEEITAETVEFLQAVAASPSGHVRGAADPRLSAFWVLKA